MKIKEFIVVEGKDDTVAIQHAVNADTIETNGSAVNQETIEKIRFAQKQRGVIIFTDPDFPGEKIRKTIAEQVEGCKHAFLPRELAIAKSGKGIGIEHATPEALRAALTDVHYLQEEPEEQIMIADLYVAGLIVGNGAKEKRERLGRLLKIGYANGKQLHKRLMLFGITAEDFHNAVKNIE